jgi:hypothetical protein
VSASLTWAGRGPDLSDLAKDIAALPGMVRSRFKPTITGAAERIVSRVSDAYRSNGWDGSRASVGPNDDPQDLTRGLRVEQNDDPADISARVINRHPLVHLVEFGTAQRSVSTARPIRVLINGQWKTVTGTNRGRMKPAKIFVPIVEEERAGAAVTLEASLRELGPGLVVLAVR